MPSVWQPDGNGFTPAFNVKMNRIHTICRFLQATWLFWIVAVVTFVYLVVRAFYSDLAYDEHWSYLAVFQESGWVQKQSAVHPVHRPGIIRGHFRFKGDEMRHPGFLSGIQIAGGG